jgi:hypothetical protein
VHELEPSQRSAALRASFLTLKRAAFKLAVFVTIASAQALAGRGFVLPLAQMCLWMALFCVVVAVARQERATAPYYNSMDEAAWFYLVGFILRRLA